MIPGTTAEKFAALAQLESTLRRLVCPHPSKLLFDSRKEAKAHIKRLRHVMKGPPKPYRCSCGYWHLTTMPGRVSRAAGKRARQRLA